LDAETGLYYYRARYYDARNGRFISQDPLGLESDDGEDQDPAAFLFPRENLYSYVANNPLNAPDPTGETEAVDTAVQQKKLLPILSQQFKCIAQGVLIDADTAAVLGGPAGTVADLSLNVISCSVLPLTAKGQAAFARTAVRLKKVVEQLTKRYKALRVTVQPVWGSVRSR
jgi:RHS repeat-associated protein